MAQLRIARPLWLDRAPIPGCRYPSLGGKSTVEVAIVGGGVTGAAVAYLFARAGISVAVVDPAISTAAVLIAAKSAGLSGAFLSGQ